VAISKFFKASTALPPSARDSLFATSFIFKVKKMNKVNGPNADKTKWIKFELLMDSDNLVSKYS
jgi:hypothetical protein